MSKFRRIVPAALLVTGLVLGTGPALAAGDYALSIDFQAAAVHHDLHAALFSARQFNFKVFTAC